MMLAFKLKKINNFFAFVQLKHFHAIAHQRHGHLQSVPVVGLEIHAQINSVSKLFSGAPNKFLSYPNSLVSNFDAAFPGTLPLSFVAKEDNGQVDLKSYRHFFGTAYRIAVFLSIPMINQVCVEKAVTTALALNCEINFQSFFDRKHYFYSDLPSGYQITQQRCPIAENGHLDYPTLDGNHTKKVKIQRIQLEQDSGKSLHDDDITFVDLNRAGVGLMEIVTNPDLSTADDSVAFVQELLMLLKHVNTCDGALNEGHFRVDVNVSIATSNGQLGTRAEVKNISGLKTIHQVIEYEILRQREILDNGENVKQETREFDEVTGKTLSLRDKEVMQDYRFIPEPNLPALQLHNDDTISSVADQRRAINVDEVRRKLLELPGQIRDRLMRDYHLNFSQVHFLLDKEFYRFFEEVISEAPEIKPSLVYEWLRMHILGYMYQCDFTSIEQCSIKAKDLAQLLFLLQSMEINDSVALDALQESFKTGKPPVEIIDESNWRMISDPDVITHHSSVAIEEAREHGLLAKYDFRDQRNKKNKKILAKIVNIVRRNTDNKAQTKITKQTILNLLHGK